MIDIKRKIRQVRWVLRCAKAAVFYRPKTIVPMMLFQTNAVCNLACAECADRVAIKQWRGYQASLDQVKDFIEATRASKIWIRELHINGLGEPTLWKNLNEGLELLARSGCIGRITMASNARSLDRIESKTWRHIYQLLIAEYAEQNPAPIIAIKKRRGSQIGPIERTVFNRIPTQRYPGTIPCKCFCPGPMWLDGRIYLNCGPAAFEAAKWHGSELESVHCKTGYLDTWEPAMVGKLPVCEYCRTNTNIKTEQVAHSQLT